MPTLPTSDSEPVLADPTPSRPVLDDKKRAKIIALVANGSSRRMAARYVRCAPSTITRTAMRDREFAEQLAVAEQNADVDALRALRVAARKPRFWRAAAWLLERRHPDEFARRPPNVYTPDQFARAMGQIIEIIDKDLPEENYQRAMEKLDEIVEMTREDFKALCDQPPKFPDLEKEWAEADRQREARERDAWDDDLDENRFEAETPAISSDPFIEPPPVQHPSSGEKQASLPTLAVTPETAYTSELQL